jgi:DNA-binding NarL/FixJ family response regulator
VIDRPRRVLVVDDHAGYRAALRRLLEADGFDVVGEAADGEAALVAIAELRPEVVLVDINLPGMDGFDVAARAAGSSRSDIVLISTRDVESYRIRLAGSPAIGFVEKRDLDGPRLRVLLDGARP